MSIAQNFPIVSPALSLDFANVQALDPRITFARATTATYYGTRTAKAEENLIAYSQEFDNAYWTKANITVSANNGVAPDGTTTAELIYPNSTGTDRIIYRNGLNGLASTIYTYSFFAKANGINWVYVGTLGGGTAPSTLLPFFDLQNGVVGQTGTFFSSASITAVGSGWYRCVVTGTSAATLLYPMVGLADGNNTGTVTASGTNGVFVWGAQLEQRSTVTAYTPTTTQPVTNYIPVLETAAAGVARFDHNPTTFESLGLLIEEQRTNLLTYSEQFDNAAWAVNQGTIVANSTVAPDGTLTADYFRENTATSNRGFSRPTYTLGTGTYTWTLYAKSTNRQLTISTTDLASGSTSAIFNLVNGTVVGTPSVSGSWTNASASITFVGNGWYRCISTVTKGAGASAATSYEIAPVGGYSYTGDGYSGAFIWGAQLEAGAFSTSYIPTVASQVTRAADSASMTGTNFSSWYNADNGTLYGEASWLGLTLVNQPIVGLDTASTQTNWFALGYGIGGYTNAMSAYGINGFLAQNASSVTSANTFYKTAVTIKTNDLALTTSSSTVSTDASGFIGSVDRLRIGTYLNGQMSGRIKKIAYYPIAATSTQIQALTT